MVGALSSRSALSVLVGALFKKFGLFLNTSRKGCKFVPSARFPSIRHSTFAMAAPSKKPDFRKDVERKTNGNAKKNSHSNNPYLGFRFGT
jgi:hypothetical protein